MTLIAAEGALTVVDGEMVGLSPVYPISGFAGVATWTSTTQQVTDEMELAAWAGAEFVRMDLYWDLVEQTEGVYDWTLADARFDSADALGLKVLWIVHASPAWARTAGEASNVWLPTDTADYITFLTAALNRYKNRGTLGCHHWQIWNEINTVWHNGDPTDYAGYVALLSAAHGTIKSADPTAKVILGPILRGGQEDAEFGAVRDTTYLTNLYAAGAKPYFDVLAYHAYCYPYDPASTTEPVYTAGASVEHGWQGVAPIKAVMTANADAGKPLWITEWGQHTGTATYSVSSADQATFLDHAFTRAFKEKAQALFVFAPRNAGADATNREHNFGVIDADFVPKPSLRAYREASAIASGDTPPIVTTAAAPDYVGVANSGTGFAATRVTGAISGSQAGDVLVAFAQGNDQSATVTPSDAGWTLLGTVALDNGRVHVLTKTATGAQGSVTWTFSGSHNHRVVVVCYRNGTQPTQLAASATSRIQTAKLENLLVPRAGARLVVCGYSASNTDATTAITPGVTSRVTVTAAVGGGVVADQAFTYSDDWSGAKTYKIGASTAATLIMSAAVFISGIAEPVPV
jgi:arabinogalactan endo-1,4-beta-galactosidase